MTEPEPFVPATGGRFLTIPSLLQRQPWLVFGFSTRAGGVSPPPYNSLNCALHVGDQWQHVLANRRRLAEWAGFTLDDMMCVQQVHQDAIYEVKEDDRGRGSQQEDALPAVDGLYTAQPGLLLTSFYADCVPLYVIDMDRRVVGLAHAGWRGTVLKIGPKLVRRFQEQFNSRPESLCAIIGPAIGACCYEVDDVVIQALKPVVPARFYPAVIKETAKGKYRIDLKGINALLFKLAGLPEQNIIQTRLCTACRPDLFFSYRRDRKKTGRMASFIAIKN